MIPLIRDSVTVATIMAAGMVIDEKALVPVGTACAAGGIIFWLGKKLQRIDDKFERLEDGQARLSTEMEKGAKVLHKRLSSLPCMRDLACNDEQIRRERE